MGSESVEERFEVGRQIVWVGSASPGPRVGVQDRELDLVLVGIEVQEELIDLVDDVGGARVGPVYLVHDQDHRQVRLERLAQHEARLRQRPLGGVDEQQDAVHHRESALDLAAEVGVTRRVDDVDLQVAVANGRVLRQDRDALLALEVGRVHDPLAHVLVRPEGPDCQSIASTSVVLPWSTWATIATLRMSSRVGIGHPW